jgi:hypothetical protein
MTTANEKRSALNGQILYRPGEVASMLRCSEWWIKEQARNRRIPFSWIGGSYRFTDEHVTEIVQIFEEKPTSGAQGVDAFDARPRNVVRRSPPRVRLRARTPRRVINSANASDAA